MEGYCLSGVVFLGTSRAVLFRAKRDSKRLKEESFFPVFYGYFNSVVLHGHAVILSGMGKIFSSRTPIGTPARSDD